jgi:hypothetical protein
VRLPYPERISLVGTFYFGLLLCGIQLAQGTDPIFSLACFAFILIAALAFNVGGGFTRPSGGYVFFYATLTIIIGIIWKAVLGEPADSNLHNPLLTISVFTFGITMMLVSVYLSTKLTTKRAILGRMVTDANMQTATVGCLVAGILLQVVGTVASGGNGSVISALNQLNRFFPMAIILGVIHSIRRSGGTRSINLPVLLAATCAFSLGILGFSKEGIITPFLCWLIAAASQRYKISRFQLAGALFATFFIFQYLVPYAQYGRTFRAESGSENLQVSLSLLSDLGYVREQYLETSSDSYGDDAGFGYYDTPQGFFDRLQEFPLDDALIEHTRQFGTFGFYPVLASFQNLVPHFIWKDKPATLFGNVYAHEIGILAEEDESTGISFSPTAEAFHLMGWLGIFLVAPCLWLALFTLFDSLCGDVRNSPWGLLAIVIFAHQAPEGGITVIAYALGYTAFGIVFAAVMGAYLMPVIGTFFIGPEGISIRRGAPIRSIPNRLHPRASSQT